MDRRTISVLLLFLLFLLYPWSVLSPPIYSICNSDKNFTARSSTYQELRQLVHTVREKATKFNFVTAHSNSSVPTKDRLYVLLQCRRDLSSNECVDCFGAAVGKLWEDCPDQFDASVWFENCFLRCGTENFFSRLDIQRSPYKRFCSNGTFDKAPVMEFSKKQGELMQRLLTQANTSGRGFATGSSIYGGPPIFGLVQCNQDVSALICSFCLSKSLPFLLECSEARMYGMVLSRNCYIRYENHMFYRENPPGRAPAPDSQTASANKSIAPAPLTAPANKTANSSEANGNKTILSNRKEIIIGVAVGMVMIMLAIAVFVVCRWKSRFSMIFHRKKTNNNTRNVDNFLKNHESHMPKRYSYRDIMKITNSMKNKLGEGGFGSVYKGEFRDGRLVAVKILSEAKGNGEDFMNEVAAISRTAHVNIVSLVGFCSERSKRALIYDFMSNGSLEKFIFTGTPEHNSLSWETLFRIALGIARGLEYLHRGCNMHILHLDIKPHNILLDHDFCPKISDFGLAKLFPEKQSAILMTRARGTSGCMAPEVSNRNFGGVSYKSDVYSFGMLLLEIVGGRKNIDIKVENMSEVYYPTWVYDRIERHDDLQLGELTEEDDEMARKMIVVGLWCIQIMPADRPSMSKVVEMLEGDVEGLQIPPKPFLSSRLE